MISSLPFTLKKFLQLIFPYFFGGHGITIRSTEVTIHEKSEMSNYPYAPTTFVENLAKC